MFLFIGGILLAVIAIAVFFFFFGKEESEYTHITKVLPYMAYNENTRLYVHQNGSVGTVFELSPSIIAADSTGFESLLDLMEDDSTVMQFLLYGSPNVSSQIDSFVNTKDRAVEDPLYGTLIKEYAKFLEDKTRNPINKLMETRLKDYRMFFSITASEKNADKLIIIAESAENILSVKGYNPVHLNPSNFLPLVYEILNMNHDFRDIPPYDDKVPLARQTLAPDTLIDNRNKKYLISDGVYFASLEPVSLPNETNLWMFSSRLGDYLSSNVDKQQFYSPFLISSSFSLLSKKANNKVKGNHTFTLAQNLPGNYFPRSDKKKTDALHTIKKMEEKAKLVQFSLNVIVSGKSETEVKRSVDVVKSYWDSGQPQQRIKLKQVSRIVPLNFFASLPMAMDKEYFSDTENYRVLFTDEAAQFIPSESDYAGSGSSTIPLITRRGQLMQFDLYDSTINYCGYIVAASGAGKSVLINFMTLMYLAKGDTVFTFDIGRSYEKLCNSIDGQWIEFNLDSPISINPFSEIKTEKEFEEGWEYLRNFIYFIGASLSKDHSDKMEKLITSHIDEALKELWGEYREKLEITHISQWFLGREEKDLVDFGQQLKPYTSAGIYGKFFSGKSEIDFKKPYVVMELDTIENMQELRDAVIMIMIFHLTQKTYHSGLNAGRIICFIDEAHKFLGTSHKIDLFIEQAYRRFRKHNASIVLATQGFDDIYSATEKTISRAGRVIINNSSWKFFLKQTEESINALKMSQLISFSDMDYHILRSVTNSKPYHSEVFISTPQGFKVVARVVIDRFMYYLFSTFMDDKIRIQKYKDKGLSMVQAIEAVIADDQKK